VKGRDWDRLARASILPVLGRGWVAKGSLLYKQPVEHILLGVNADTLYESTTLHLEAVVMPLYVPFPALMYFVPNRLGRIEVVDGALKPKQIELIRSALPFLGAHATPSRLLADRSWKDRDASNLEYEAYSHLLAGSLDKAKGVLDTVRRFKPEPDGPDWVAEAAKRCAQIDALLDRSPAEAQAQLVDWEEQNLLSLRLKRS
jgi:hypothetical protein